MYDVYRISLYHQLLLVYYSVNKTPITLLIMIIYVYIMLNDKDVSLFVPLLISHYFSQFNENVCHF